MFAFIDEEILREMKTREMKRDEVEFGMIRAIRGPMHHRWR